MKGIGGEAGPACRRGERQGEGALLKAAEEEPAAGLAAELGLPEQELGDGGGEDDLFEAVGGLGLEFGAVAEEVSKGTHGV